MPNSIAPVPFFFKLRAIHPNIELLQGLYGEDKEKTIVKGNLEFDWGYWSKTLDIEVDEDDCRPRWITSPAQMVQDEIWRRSRVERGVQDASSFPCDYFVFGLGEQIGRAHV